MADAELELGLEAEAGAAGGRWVDAVKAVSKH
jgi:hypothetical protein